MATDVIQIRIDALTAAAQKNIKPLTNELNNLNNASKKSGKSFDNLGLKMQTFGGKMNVLGQRISLSMSLPLLLFGKDAIDTAVSVERAFIRFEKVFSGTESDLEALKGSAGDLAIKFGRPIEDMLEVMGEFNKAGVESREELEKIAEVTAGTAIVFDTDMTKALNGVKSVMLGFNLTAAETETALAKINYIADKTTASEEGILEVMNRSAGVARSYGFALESVASAQGVFEKNAIPAGRAGNALKSIIISLGKQSNVAKDHFADLGVSIEKGTEQLEFYSAASGKTIESLEAEGINAKNVGKHFDDLGIDIGKANDKFASLSLDLGTFKGSERFSEKIDGATESLSEFRTMSVEEKLKTLSLLYLQVSKSGDPSQIADFNEAVADMFGKFQANNVTALLQDMSLEFDNSEESISQYFLGMKLANDEQGALKWQLEQINKVLDSSPQKLDSLNEKYRLQKAILGNELLPIKMKLLEAVTDLIEKFNSLSPEMKKWIINIGLAVVVAGPLLAILGNIITTLGVLGPMIKTGATLLATLGSKFAVATTGAKSFNVATNTNVVSSGKFMSLLKGGLIAGAALWATGKVIEAGIAIVGFKENMDDLREKSKTTRETLNKLQDRFGTLNTGLANEQYQKAWDKADALQKINEDLQKRYEGWPGVWNAFKDGFEEFSVDMTDKFLDAADTLIKWIKKVKEVEGQSDEQQAKAIKKGQEIYAGASSAYGYYAKGGVVYAANGFAPKGRDTVPAMLSPGEMVLNKSQQANLFNMASGKSQSQGTAPSINVEINVGTMIASRGEQREFARRIQELIGENLAFA
jgi:minor tail protein